METTEIPSAQTCRPPAAPSGPYRFYVHLVRRYWKLLALMTCLASIFGALSGLRLLAVGLLFDVMNTPARGRPGRFVRGFDAVWAHLSPSGGPTLGEKLAARGADPAGSNIFFQFIAGLAVALLVIAVLLALTYYLKEMLAHRIVVRQLTDIRTAMFNHLTRQSVSYFGQRRGGDLISRSTNDVDAIYTALRAICDSLVQHPIVMAGSLSAACIANWRLFLIGMPAYFLLAIPIARSGREVLRHGRRRLERVSLVTDALQQLFGGIRIVKAFGMEPHERTAFAEKNRAFERSFIRTQAAKVRGRTIQDVIYNVLLAGLLVLGGWYLTDPDQIAGFVVFVMAMVQLYAPIKALSTSWNQLQESIPAVNRVTELLAETPAVRNTPGARLFPGLEREIRFDDVFFDYRSEPGNRPIDDFTGGARGESKGALRGIRLTVKKGDVIALVGPSGAGKSTLVDVLARFYDPQAGAVLVDGADIREFRYRSYLGAIAIVSQDPFLFNTTIRANIRYGREEATDADVEEAARLANAHDFIMAQPEGYETVIGDRGARLSGGQRQRLTIARALLKNAPILILDEATSSLDTESERAVQIALDNLMHERTTFIVAHRLSTIAASDRIVVLDEGRIVEEGTHDELLAKGGLYFRLYSIQTIERPAC